MPNNSPSFGMTPGNNAPMPIFGSTNPTGGLYNFGDAKNGMPSFSLFGNPNGGPVSPMANAPMFGTPNNTNGLNSGFGFLPGGQQYGPSIYNDLGKAIGKGPGQLAGNIIEQGLFNPQTADAFINAMQPSVNRGQANILQAFGSEGSRFGSSAALGLGDYMSQVNLNESQVMAQMYMQAQQEQLSLLEGLLPTLHAEQANKGGMWQDIVGGLEMAGGAASMFVPGLQGVGAMLIGSGAGTFAKGMDGGGGGGGNGGSGGFQFPMSPNLMGGNNPWGNTGTFGPNAPNMDQWVNDWMMNEQSGSAASSLGGFDAATNSSPFTMFN